MGATGRDDQDAVLDASRKLGVPYASRENAILRMERGQSLERLIPKDVALREAVLPLFLDRGQLAVAMPDPRDQGLIERLWKLTGHEIRPFISTRAQILDAVAIDYR